MESAEVKRWYRDFAMKDLWQRSSDRQTAVMTGFYSGGSARYLERPAEDELQQLL